MGIRRRCFCEMQSVALCGRQWCLQAAFQAAQTTHTVRPYSLRLHVSQASNCDAREIRRVFHVRGKARFRSQSVIQERANCARLDKLKHILRNKRVETSLDPADTSVRATSADKKGRP
jgi:hypothetical protein